jgi:hypothetical protein
VAADVQGAYSTGFQVNEEPDGKWHPLKISTSRRGVKLVCKQGYLSEGPVAVAEVWSKEQWAAVLRHPLGSSAIHLDAHVRRVKDAPAGTLDIIVQVEPGDLHFRPNGQGIEAQYEIAIAERVSAGIGRVQSEAGAFTFPKEKASQVLPENLRYQYHWTLSNGATGLRLLYHDKLTGRYGTLEVPLNKIAGS